MDQGYHTQRVLLVQPIIAAQTEIGPSLTVEEQKRLELFQRLHPTHIGGEPIEDAHVFLYQCQRILRTLGLVHSMEVTLLLSS